LFKTILKPKEAEGHTLTYQPKALVHGVPEQALSFVKNMAEPSDKGFEINTLVAKNTGVSDLERKNFHNKLEEQVLTRLKSVEEKAYAEAYALGLQDGRNKAFEETKAAIQTSLNALAEMLQHLGEIKNKLVIENEKHIVETIFHIAKNLAIHEINANPDVIRDVIRLALENAQAEEQLTLHLGPQDSAFLETVKKEAGNPLERISKLRIELDETMTPGGCIVETNYGIIDATIEQRIQKLWEVIKSKVPKSAS
jgi:flagellar assembly protein FliH